MLLGLRKKVKLRLKSHVVSVYTAGMTTTRKDKVEVLLTPAIKASFEAICQEKGISIADGLRRAIESWMKGK